jgi:cytochrome b561
MNRRAWMIAFHWLTALLVAASFSVAWARNAIDDLAARALWLDVHRSIGFAVLALTLLRLALRWGAGPVSSRGDLPLGMWMASRATHLLIYAGLIAMPLLGWAQSSARARHFKLFGLPVPSLVRHDADLAERLGSWHAQLGWVLLGLIGLHALAALYHHYVLRDHVLRAMLPRPIPPYRIAMGRGIMRSMVEG